MSRTLARLAATLIAAAFWPGPSAGARAQTVPAVVQWTTASSSADAPADGRLGHIGLLILDAAKAPVADAPVELLVGPNAPAVGAPAAACGIRTSALRTDATGRVSLQDARLVGCGSTAVLVARVVGGPSSAPLVVRIAAPPARRVDSVYVIQVPGSGSHAWYVNQYLRYPFEVRLRGVTGERECRARRVRFEATQGALASAGLTPPERVVAGEWGPDEREGSRCRAQVRWRLGDVPGSQELRAALVRDTADTVPVHIAESAPATFRASAHQVPGLVGGFAYLDRRRVPDNASADDSTLAGRGQPFFGIEFAPLVYVPTRFAARALEHTRLVIATSYRKPGYDFYVGLNPLVLFDGPRSTALAVRPSVGRRWNRRGSDSYFAAVTVDGASLVGGVLNTFGITPR